MQFPENQAILKKATITGFRNLLFNDKNTVRYYNINNHVIES